MSEGDQGPVHEDQAELKTKKSFAQLMKPSLGSLIFILATLIILFLISLPDYHPHMHRNYDVSALTWGRSAKQAAEIYFEKYRDDLNSPEYEHSLDILDKLLPIKKSINYDRDVTFTFTSWDSLGFSFTTRHRKGGKTFIFSDDAEKQP